MIVVTTTAQLLARFAFLLIGNAALVCVLMHLATFWVNVPVGWLNLPFFLIFLAGVTMSLARFGRSPSSTNLGLRKWLPTALLIGYALATFAYGLIVSGGASSNIRVVTADAAQRHENLWVRVVTAWMLMLSWVLWLNLASAIRERNIKLF